MMTLDNGPAHRQADPHTAGLRRVERVEEPVRALALKTHPGIPHGQEHAIACVASGTDEQLPGPALDRAHRIYGVANQVQNDLLQLHAIARHSGKISCKLRSWNDAVLLPDAERQRNHLSCRLVEVDGLSRGFLFAVQLAQSGDDVRYAVRVAD